MAVRDYTRQIQFDGAIVITWEGLTGADTGKPVCLPHYPDKSIQFGLGGGATHGGATTVLQGTNDLRGDPDHPDHANAKWQTLQDSNESAITTTADTLPIQVLQSPLWVRPSQSAGSAGDLDIGMLCLKENI